MRADIHKELLEAFKQNDYEKICQFLHTNNYSSDSEYTTQRCKDSFIQGFKAAQKYKELLSSNHWRDG